MLRPHFPAPAVPAPPSRPAWPRPTHEGDALACDVVSALPPRGGEVYAQGPSADQILLLASALTDPQVRTADAETPEPNTAPADTPDPAAPPAPARLPVRRADLLLRPLGDRGRYVVKDPRTAAYFTIGEQEYFLLCQLDGERHAEAVRAAFEQRFGEPLPAKDLDGFLDLARSRGLLQADGLPGQEPAAAEGAAAPTSPAPEAPAPRERQSLLYWRRSVFDPDKLFTWLAPRLSFLWTRSFLFLSLGGILAAALVFWANCREAVGYLPQALTWQTALLAWVTMGLVTTCHEFAHGLTCKRHGGEVHEVGFLLMFFIPCFYCNVSDAWLFKEKSKRLGVTLAGGYCDLCLWALAVFTWRLALPGSLPYYLAWVVMSICGVRIFFNFNPLLKLDGYYLLSDWLEIPNLRQRSLDRLAAWLRCLLWGAPRPGADPRGRLLLWFGLASWLFSVAYLVLLLAALFHVLAGAWGLAGAACVGWLAWALLGGMFRGFTGGEVRQMFVRRHRRALAWGLVLAGAAAVLIFVETEERAAGPFRLRPASRAEVRAPVAGFLQAVCADEGSRVSAGALVAYLEVPDLTSRLAQKRAEVGEAGAKLRLLEIGARPEEVAEQRQRVTRAREWRDLAREDLRRSREALDEELVGLEKQVTQARAELQIAGDARDRYRTLLQARAASDAEYLEKERKLEACQARLEQTEAEKRARRAKGVLEVEGELARRAKELADAQATLTLLEAGSRPEEVAAERARLKRLHEEAAYLEVVQQKLRVASPVGGVVITPRLREKINHYFKEGDLICEVEEPAALEAEVTLQEQDVAAVRVGQEVELKLRALPFETLRARVERIAPSTAKGEKGEVQGTVTVTCRVEGAGPEAGLGMSGHARIACGSRSLGGHLVRSVLRFVRTEFWW